MKFAHYTDRQGGAGILGKADILALTDILGTLVALMFAAWLAYKFWTFSL